MKNATTPANGETMPVSSDAGLVRLGAELEVAWAVQDEAESGDDIAAFEAAHAVCLIIAERIIAMPATTLDGMRVKARVVSWCHSGEPFGDGDFGSTTDLRMASSIVRDILGTAPRP